MTKNIIKIQIIFITLSTLILAFLTDKYLIEKKKNKLHDNISNIGSFISQDIQKNISLASNKVYALEYLLKNEYYKTDNFQNWAKIIIENTNPSINILQLAKDGKISHIYPLEGNESILFHDLLKDKRRIKGAKLAIKRNKLTLIGPIKLIQNNINSIILRKPIFKENQFWGFSIALIYIDSIIDKYIKLMNNNNLEFQILGNNPDAEKRPIFSQNKNFILKEHLTFDILIPNGTWTLHINTKDEIKSNYLIYLFFFLFSLIFSFLIIKNQKKSKKFLKDLELQRERTPLPLLILNRKGKVTYLNQAAIETFGFEKKELLNTYYFDKIVPEDKAFQIQMIFEELEKKNIIIKNTNENITKKGKRITCEWFNSNIYNNKGEHLAYMCIAIDITEKIQVQKLLLEQEQQLHDSFKMVQMGQMIENIAHQWRQPLNGISVIASGLQMEKEYGQLNDEHLDKSLKSIVKNTKFLSETINTFRDFIKEKKEKGRFNLIQRIELTLNIIDSALTNNNIELSFKKDHQELFINSIATELSQVLLNILNNAKEALIYNQIQNPKILISYQQEKEKVTIFIEDNAGGIPVNIMNKIFEAYFTTKTKDSGTGIGLHMSKEIVTKSLNGSIYVENTPQGARFSIEISTI